MSWDGGYVGINSFGFGGSNVHVLLRTPDTVSHTQTTHAATMSARLVTCAGRTKEGVEATLTEASRHPTDIDMQCLLESSVGELSPVTHPYRGAALVNTATSRQTVEVHTATFIPSRWLQAGFPRLPESPGIFIGKFPRPGKSWNVTLALQSPGNLLARS